MRGSTGEQARKALAPGGHVPVLDGVRGLAILIVVFYHARGAMRPESGADFVYHQLLSVGWCGVDLFFVLSGFLITGILLDSRGESGCLRRFFARRVLRIFPLYYLFLFTALALWPALGAPPAQLDYLELHSPFVYLFYMQNVVFPVAGNAGPVLTPTWSLAVEEQFYVLWPIAVLSFSRGRLGRLCLLLMSGCLLYRCLVAMSGGGALLAYQPLWARMDSLAAGGLVALVARSGWHRDLLAALACLALLASGALLVSLHATHGGLHFGDPHAYTMGLSCVAVFFASGLLLVLRCRDTWLVRATLGSRLLRTCGKYSYCMYLTHNAWRLACVEGLWGGGAPSLLGSQITGQMLLFALMAAGSAAVAWLTWRVWERPFLSLKRFFPRPDEQPGPAHGPLAPAA